MSSAIHLISAIITFVGACVVLVAMIGTIRLPDSFCRSHSLGKGLTLGLVLLLVGLWIDLGTEAAGLKIPAAIFFQFLTLPVATHLVAGLSHRKKLPRYGEPLINRDQRAQRRAAKNSAPSSNA
jgi:multicomponent Na+:H+ antiporter subunit G